MGKNPFELIANNYIEMNKMMVKEIELATAHPGLTGNYREEMWKKFFRDIIPQKFSLVHGAMIIDSNGGISNEVDIAVIDEQYTPYIFQYHTLKLIPIEAVSMVIECKSKRFSQDMLTQLEEWAKSIDKLNTKQVGIARFANGYTMGFHNSSQTNTRPIKVLVSLKESIQDSTLDKLKDGMGNYFDFIIQEQPDESDGQKMFQVLVKHEDKTLGWWGEHLNNKEAKPDPNKGLQLTKSLSAQDINVAKQYELNVQNDNLIMNKLKDLRVPGNPLLTLNLQLNQLLMLLNNPMLFPHFAYAKKFKKSAE
ncbi:DUF6602 domain-containing protein [Paenibacillus sp. SYP-B4298]|uniref:DUF6602 domain-containing protein n=1 Tax=Paenibacillus sp. SYP-B4298 TaxID=2996034 RepID=UPI0022DE1DF7|nr:DUF6602 domain-containing protein [Paenibacillus sp. SYP-B4298]